MANTSNDSPKRQEDMSAGKPAANSPYLGLQLTAIATNRTSPRPQDHSTSHPNELQPRPKSRNTVGSQHTGRSASGAPAVHLDMDLDVDIQLKAKIQGDLELSIL